MNKSAFVTGGAKRIGKAISLFLAGLGYDIALHYNSSEREANETAMEIRSQGVRCVLFQRDLSDGAQLQDLMSGVASEFPNLCALVNNASIFGKATIADTTVESLKENMMVNFIAPYILSSKFASIVKSGNIINIIDTKTAKNDNNYSAYTLSKKAFAEFTKMAAKEFAPNIRVNAINPGIILPPKGENESYLDGLIDLVPLKKKGGLHNITNAVGFILDNDYLTGQLIFVDGGKNL